VALDPRYARSRRPRVCGHCAMALNAAISGSILAVSDSCLVTRMGIALWLDLGVGRHQTLFAQGSTATHSVDLGSEADALPAATLTRMSLLPCAQLGRGPR
jgi:hypothetical protein